MRLSSLYPSLTSKCLPISEGLLILMVHISLLVVTVIFIAVPAVIVLTVIEPIVLVPIVLVLVLVPIFILILILLSDSRVKTIRLALTLDKLQSEAILLFQNQAHPVFQHLGRPELRPDSRVLHQLLNGSQSRVEVGISLLSAHVIHVPSHAQLKISRPVGELLTHYLNGVSVVVVELDADIETPDRVLEAVGDQVEKERAVGLIGEQKLVGFEQQCSPLVISEAARFSILLDS
jgi:hypothetical protein